MELVLQALIEAEATAVIGASHYERSDTRTNQRNGSRDRLLIVLHDEAGVIDRLPHCVLVGQPPGDVWVANQRGEEHRRRDRQGRGPPGGLPVLLSMVATALLRSLWQT